jgi:hypothetical protein
MRFPLLFLICRFVCLAICPKSGKHRQAAPGLSDWQEESGERGRNISIMQPGAKNYFPHGMVQSISIDLLIGLMSRSRVGRTRSVKTSQK